MMNKLFDVLNEEQKRFLQSTLTEKILRQFLWSHCLQTLQKMNPELIEFTNEILNKAVSSESKEKNLDLYLYRILGYLPEQNDSKNEDTEQQLNDVKLAVLSGKPLTPKLLDSVAKFWNDNYLVR